MQKGNFSAGECLIPGAYDPWAHAYTPCPSNLDRQSRQKYHIENPSMQKCWLRSWEAHKSDL